METRAFETQENPKTINQILEECLCLNRIILDLHVPSQTSSRKMQHYLIKLFNLLEIPLSLMFERKMAHNRKKYTVKECQRSSNDVEVKKYTQLAKVTGVTKKTNDDEQYLNEEEFIDPGKMGENASLNFAKMIEDVSKFADERGWSKDDYNIPRIICCMVSELGELLDVLQWKPGNSTIDTVSLETRNKIAAELTDILVYYIHYERVHGGL